VSKARMDEVICDFVEKIDRNTVRDTPQLIPLVPETAVMVRRADRGETVRRWFSLRSWGTVSS
jgi:hypothetical protein